MANLLPEVELSRIASALTLSESETEIEKFSWADLEDLNRDMSKRKSAPDAGFKDYPDMNGAYSDLEGDEG